MKSCRNCVNAQHDGYYHIRLICKINSMVVVPFSSSTEENQHNDTHAQVKAKLCKWYTQEPALTSEEMMRVLNVRTQRSNGEQPLDKV